MKNINRLLTCLGVTVACLAGISQSAYASVAGHVQFVSGNVQITSPAGQTRPAQKGDAVSEGDTLTSAPSSSAQIKMQDGGFVAVRADTKLKFDEFVFAGKQDGNEKSFFSLFKGGFRAVTGLIGQINKQNYKITTPAATIGIRGTDHETFMITPDSPLALAAPTGAYSKVNVGETFMSTEKGTIFVQPNQMGFAGGLNQAPEVLPVNTNIFTVAAAPTAKAKVEKKEDKKDDGKKEGEESSQDKQTAKSEQNGEESKKSDDTAPVREAAVVDATPPAAGSIPAATTPVMSAGTTGMPVFAPIEVLPPIVLTAGGQTINLTTQTTTTAGGIPVAITGNTPAYAALNGFGFEALGVDAAGMWINPFDSNLPATSYLLDAGNNLVEVVGGISPGKVAGGMAKDTYVAADSSVYFGRWQGGTYTDSLTLVSVAMGNTSMQWVLSANPPVGFVQTLAGKTNYSLTAATHPTDKLGNVGTLTAATLSADFTAQIVNISLALAFSTADPNFISTQNKAFSVTTPNGISIFGETIWGLGTVACSGANCDIGGYSADIWARFAATTANKVAIPYNIVGATDLVQGVAMATAATAPVVTPVAPAGAVAPFMQTDKAVAFAQFNGTYFSYNQTSHIFLAAPADIAPLVGAGPGTVTLVDRYSSQGPGAGTRTYTLYGATVGEATTTLANGIQFGRYTSTSADQVVVGMINNGLAPGTYPTPYTPVQTHWITGPALDPVYLPEVLLGSNTYTFTAGNATIPTSSFGSNASLNSATLSVNFTQQLVSFTLNLMVNTIPWVASSTNAPLELHYWNNGMSGFRADNSIVTPPVIKQGGDLTLTVNGTPVTAAPPSIVKGQLTGAGLNGALLSYFLDNGSDQITGVAAFTGTAQNTATPYRLVALSAADPAPSADQFPGGAYPVGGMVPIPVVVGGYNNASSVLMDGAGNLTTFRASNNQILFTATTVGTAVTATGLGTDPVSGISWGRWDNASFKTTDVVSGLVSTNNNTGSAHWIASPNLVGPVTLPVTGVFNYVLAGGTVPTDSLGGIGTLNSASLTANFSAQTVAIGLNVTTPNAGNLIATTAPLLIEQGSMFNASTTGAVNTGGIPGSLTITCGAGCVGTPQGGLGGAFTGPGGIGAAVLYGFAAGANNTTIVNGAVAFHR